MRALDRVALTMDEAIELADSSDRFESARERVVFRVRWVEEAMEIDPSDVCFEGARGASLSTSPALVGFPALSLRTRRSFAATAEAESSTTPSSDSGTAERAF